jgi:hypothetical protein
MCPNELVWAIVETGDAPSSDASTGEKGCENLLGMVMMQPSAEGWNCSFFVKKTATRKGHATNAVTAAVKWMKQHVDIFEHEAPTVPPVVLMDHEAINLGSGGVVQHVLDKCGGKRVADTARGGETFCNYVLDLADARKVDGVSSTSLPLSSSLSSSLEQYIREGDRLYNLYLQYDPAYLQFIAEKDPAYVAEEFDYGNMAAARAEESRTGSQHRPKRRQKKQPKQKQPVARSGAEAMSRHRQNKERELAAFERDFW